MLAKINGRAQAEKEMKEIRDELGDETGGFGELLRPGVRLAVVIGIVLMVLSQINGVNMILHLHADAVHGSGNHRRPPMRSSTASTSTAGSRSAP